MQPINELLFKWYDADGIEIPFPPENPWLFEVHGQGFRVTDVRKIELPVFDSASYVNNPKVKIHLSFFFDENNKFVDFYKPEIKDKI